jgi:hypothetical protein
MSLLWFDIIISLVTCTCLLVYTGGYVYILFTVQLYCVYTYISMMMMMVDASVSMMSVLCRLMSP